MCGKDRLLSRLGLENADKPIGTKIETIGQRTMEIWNS
jgi:hypothetical protein